MNRTSEKHWVEYKKQYFATLSDYMNRTGMTLPKIKNYEKERKKALITIHSFHIDNPERPDPKHIGPNLELKEAPKVKFFE